MEKVAKYKAQESVLKQRVEQKQVTAKISPYIQYMAQVTSQNPTNSLEILHEFCAESVNLLHK